MNIMILFFKNYKIMKKLNYKKNLLKSFCYYKRFSLLFYDEMNQSQKCL